MCSSIVLVDTRCLLTTRSPDIIAACVFTVFVAGEKAAGGHFTGRGQLNRMRKFTTTKITVLCKTVPGSHYWSEYLNCGFSYPDLKDKLGGSSRPADIIRMESVRSDGG